MTQKQIISLTNQAGLFINPKTPKSSIIKTFNSILDGTLPSPSSKWVSAATTYSNIIKAEKRNKILNNLIK